MIRQEFEDRLIDLVSDYIKNGEDFDKNDESIEVDLCCEGENGIEFDLALTVSNIDPDA